MPTYLDGLHTALTWTIWALGAATPLAALAIIAAALWWVAGLLDDATRVHRVRCRTRRTGRTPGL